MFEGSSTGLMSAGCEISVVSAELAASSRIFLLGELCHGNMVNDRCMTVC